MASEKAANSTIWYSFVYAKSNPKHIYIIVRVRLDVQINHTFLGLQFQSAVEGISLLFLHSKVFLPVEN